MHIPYGNYQVLDTSTIQCLATKMVQMLLVCCCHHPPTQTHTQTKHCLMVVSSKNSTQCLFQTTAIQSATTTQLQTIVQVEHSTAEHFDEGNPKNSHGQNTCQFSGNLAGVMLEMDMQYNSSFSLWIRNPENAVFVAKRLKPFLFEYSAEVLFNAVEWIWVDWDGETRDIFLYNLIPKTMSKIADALSLEEEDKFKRLFIQLSAKIKLEL